MAASISATDMPPTLSAAEPNTQWFWVDWPNLPTARATAARVASFSVSVTTARRIFTDRGEDFLRVPAACPPVASRLL